jgi:hypothetical protein
MHAASAGARASITQAARESPAFCLGCRKARTTLDRVRACSECEMVWHARCLRTNVCGACTVAEKRRTEMRKMAEKPLPGEFRAPGFLFCCMHNLRHCAGELEVIFDDYSASAALFVVDHEDMHPEKSHSPEELELLRASAPVIAPAVTVASEFDRVRRLKLRDDDWKSIRVNQAWVEST